LFFLTEPNESKDPLCALSKAAKLRICGSVLNSTYFDGKIEYVPNGQLYVDHCERIKVSLQTEKAKIALLDVTNSIPYEEWVISCPAEPITDSNAEFTYFISRAYNSHTAFVYTRDYLTADMYKLENVSRNISVIIDECIEPFCIGMYEN
jgi:hypothetical protein